VRFVVSVTVILLPGYEDISLIGSYTTLLVSKNTFNEICLIFPSRTNVIDILTIFSVLDLTEFFKFIYLSFI
jgi:hypothetical protein